MAVELQLKKYHIFFEDLIHPEFGCYRDEAGVVIIKLHRLRLGHAEYVDQFYELHPHRFYEPSFRGQIDGWQHSLPKRIDHIFKRNHHPMRGKSMDVIFNDGFYPTVSDHFGYLAKFQLF